jgi:hypothetical protein
MSTNDNTGFGKFVPGFEFMQQLARQATGGLMQGVASHAPLPQIPNLSAWVAPTFNVEELEKRIDELKAVHFWLEQNTRALSATIQALEVQKMTLSTLKSMNVSFADVASALKTKATDSLSSFAGLTPSSPISHAEPSTTSTEPRSNKPEFAGLEIPPRRYAAPSVTAPVPSPVAQPEPSNTAAEEDTQVPSPQPNIPNLDPIQGWNTLTQQFQTLAVNAIKDVSPHTVLEAGKHMASTLTREAMKTASDMTANMTRSLVPPTPVSSAPSRQKTDQASSATDDSPATTKRSRKTTTQKAAPRSDAASVSAQKAATTKAKTSTSGRTTSTASTKTTKTTSNKPR